MFDDTPVGIFVLIIVGVVALALIIKVCRDKLQRTKIRKLGARDILSFLGFLIVALPIAISTLLIMASIVVTGGIAWTAIWLVSKIIAAVVFFPPALILEGVCDNPGPKKAVTMVLRLKWDFWSSPKAENNNAAAAASSTSARNTVVATAPQTTATPSADRDVELGLSGSDSNTSSTSTAEMDITDTGPRGPDSEPLPSYHSSFDIHRDGPPPAYEFMGLGSINQPR